jgi:uncharacterized protein
MADAQATSGFYSARPLIKLDGEVDTGLTDGLLSLLVEESTDGLYRFEATFGNWGSSGSTVGFLYFDRQVLDFGKSISVVAGDRDTESTLFEGRITALEARFPQDSPAEIGVLAEDRLQDLRMVRRTRTFEDASDSDIFEQIASAHSLQREIDIDGPTYPVLAQVNQSDLAFLRERARAIDAEVWVSGSKLFAQARGRRNQGTLNLAFGAGLREFSVLADVANQRTSLTVNGWDVETKEAVAYEAAEVSIRNELNGFQSGSTVVQQAFGNRAERIVHMVPFSDGEARSFAEASYRKMARRFVTGKAMAEGDGRLRVGTRVDLTGVGPLFEGLYYVTEVCHTYDGMNGFRTAFSVERPGLNQ